MTLLLIALLSAAPMGQWISVQNSSCIGQTTWTSYTTPTPITIWSAEVSLFSDGGVPFPGVDIYSTIFAVHPSWPKALVLVNYGLDRYTPEVGPSYREKAFPSHLGVVLPAGGSLVFEHRCEAVFGLASHSRSGALVSYTE